MKENAPINVNKNTTNLPVRPAQIVRGEVTTDEISGVFRMCEMGLGLGGRKSPEAYAFWPKF